MLHRTLQTCLCLAYKVFGIYMAQWSCAALLVATRILMEAAGGFWLGRVVRHVYDVRAGCIYGAAGDVLVRWSCVDIKYSRASRVTRGEVKVSCNHTVKEHATTMHLQVFDISKMNSR
jgi:hypothetical protein